MAAITTTFAPPVLNNFHFYSACGNSLSWNPDWYTQDWFTVSRSYYDAQASTGQVEPPLSVILTEPVCSQLSRSLASESRLSQSSLLSASSLASVSSLSVAAAATVTATTTSNPSPASFSSLPSATGTGTGSATGTAAAAPISTSTQPVTNSTPTDRPSGQPTCAGDWDPQAKAVVAATVWSTLVGLLIWVLFALVRGRALVLYEARRWFAPVDDRPYPVHASLLSFLFPPVPFLPSLRTGSASDETLAIRTLFTALKIAFTWTVLSLVTTLPLYLINVPCGTTVRSRYGGALGSLSDLSILRLLDAISNPLSSTTTSPSTNSLLSELKSFATSDTATNPPNAHTRLLILTILVPLITTLPGLFTVLRGFNSLVRHRNKFLHVTCAGLEIGFLPFKEDGLGEERMREVLREEGLMKKHGVVGEMDALLEGEKMERLEGAGRSEDEEKQKWKENELKVEVISVFGVPTTKRLDGLMEERKGVLDRLEESEMKYINSFSVNPVTRIKEEENGGGGRPSGRHRRISSQAPTSFVAPSTYYRLKQPTFPSSPTPSPPNSPGPAFSSSARPQPQRTESRFREVDRDSGFFGGKAGKLQVGNRLRPDSQHEGQLVLDPSPESEDPGYRTSGGFASGGDSNPTTPGERERASRERERYQRERMSSREDVISASDDLGRGEVSRVMRHRGGSDPTPPPTAMLASSSAPGSIPIPEVAIDGPPALRQRRGTLSETSLVPLHDRIDAGMPTTVVGQGVKPRRNVTSGELKSHYDGIRENRAELKRLNGEIEDEQGLVFDEMAAGRGMLGFMLVGRGLRFVPGIRIIEGFTKEDIVWNEIQKGSKTGRMKMAAFWTLVVLISVALAAAMMPFLALTVADAPGVNEYLGVLRKVAASTNVSSAIVEGLVPALAISFLMILAVVLVNLSSRLCGAISLTRRRFVAYQAVCAVVLIICGAWLVAAAALIFATQAFVEGTSISQTVADGSIFASAFLFIFLINLSLIAPGLQLLQPVRAWKMLRALRSGATPRQKFRASKPRLYNSSYGAAVCLLAVFYAATFIILFPLIGIPVVVILLLSLVALRYTQYYVYSNMLGNSGGIYALWSLRRFGVILACQPLLFGLILASRDEWNFAIAMFVVAGIALLIVELFTAWRGHRPTFRSLPSSTRQSLKSLRSSLLQAATPRKESQDAPGDSQTSSTRGRRRSHASIMDMMARILPGGEEKRKLAVPLRTEAIDDLISTEVAARTHPNAPPHLPPLAFADPAEELRAFIYPPSLLAAPPTIWLKNDEAGVGRLEVIELGRYHHLQGIATDLDNSDHQRTTTSTPARR